MVIICILTGIIFYFLGNVTMALTAAKKVISEEQRLREENHVVPKEDEHKIQILHNVEWAIILESLLENEDLAMYNRLYYSFQPDEIEQIYDSLIAQDLINRINNNLEL